METPCTASSLSYVFLNAVFIRKDNATKDGIVIYRVMPHIPLSSEGQNLIEGDSYVTQQGSQNPSGAH